MRLGRWTDVGVRPYMFCASAQTLFLRTIHGRIGSQNPHRVVVEIPFGAGGTTFWHRVLRRAKNALLRMTGVLFDSLVNASATAARWTWAAGLTRASVPTCAS